MKKHTLSLCITLCLYAMNNCLPIKPSIIFNFDTLFYRDQKIPAEKIAQFIKDTFLDADANNMAIIQKENQTVENNNVAEEEYTNIELKESSSWGFSNLLNPINLLKNVSNNIKKVCEGVKIYCHQDTIKKEINDILFKTLDDIGLPEEYRCYCKDCDLCTPSPIHINNHSLPCIISALMVTNNEKKYHDLTTHLESNIFQKEFIYTYFNKEQMKIIISKASEYLYKSKAMNEMIQQNINVIDLCTLLKKDEFPLYITGDLTYESYTNFLTTEKANPIINLFPEDHQIISWKKGYLSHNPLMYKDIIENHGECIIVNPINQKERFKKSFGEKVLYIHNNGDAAVLKEELLAIFAQKNIHSSI
jgi:hypothetical protein